MNNYLIKLIPVGKFFFGGDVTFSVGAKERPKNWNTLTKEEQAKVEKEIKDNNRYSSYIIKSEKFPQQTSLLGMLRFLLLRNNQDLFDIDKNKIKEGEAIKNEIEELIGKMGFTANKKDEDGNSKENFFGVIKRVSSSFLMKGESVITRIPMDYGFEKVVLSGAKQLFYNDNSVNLSKIVSGKNNNGDEIFYSAKNGIYTHYGDGKSIYAEDEIFIEDQRIGISRCIMTGKTQDNALFKQVNYRLADGFCFAFFVEIHKDINNYSNQVVSVGADNSQFIIQVLPAEFLQPILPSSNVTTEGCYGKVVLTSPALIDKEMIKKADFAMAQTIPFRYMETTIDLKSYHRLSSGISHSKKEFLFQTGSVFYFRSSDSLYSFKVALEKRKDFCQIGYNQYQIVQ